MVAVIASPLEGPVSTSAQLLDVSMALANVPLEVVSSSVPVKPTEAALVIVGASLTAVIVTVEVPVPVSAPPVPCAPALPSLNVHTTYTLAGGASLLLLYAIKRITEFTTDCVALLLRVNNSVPLLFVVTVPTVVLL